MPRILPDCDPYLRVVDDVESSGYGPAHVYRVYADIAGDTEKIATIAFQEGPIREHGVNGLSGEVLLAILADRLRHFQAGAYTCEENAEALQHIEAAAAAMARRTAARQARGVEGTSLK